MMHILDLQLVYDVEHSFRILTSVFPFDLLLGCLAETSQFQAVVVEVVIACPGPALHRPIRTTTSIRRFYNILFCTYSATTWTRSSTPSCASILRMLAPLLSDFPTSAASEKCYMSAILSDHSCVYFPRPLMTTLTTANSDHDKLSFGD